MLGFKAYIILKNNVVQNYRNVTKVVQYHTKNTYRIGFVSVVHGESATFFLDEVNEYAAGLPEVEKAQSFLEDTGEYI